MKKMGNIEKEPHGAVASPCEAVPGTGDSGIFEGDLWKERRERLTSSVPGGVVGRNSPG